MVEMSITEIMTVKRVRATIGEVMLTTILQGAYNFHTVVWLLGRNIEIPLSLSYFPVRPPCPEIAWSNPSWSINICYLSNCMLTHPFFPQLWDEFIPFSLGVWPGVFGNSGNVEAFGEIKKKNRDFRVFPYVYLPLQILNIHFALTLCLSTSTLRKTKFEYLSDNSAKKGRMKWQGPHQVAVKSTTTYIQCI